MARRFGGRRDSPVARRGGNAASRRGALESRRAGIDTRPATLGFSKPIALRRLQQLRRALARELKRARKKRDAVARDLERANEASTLQAWANLLLAHAHEIPADAESFDAPSFEAPGELVRIPLSADRSATEEAQALFARAKRLKRGLAVVPERFDATEKRVAELEALEAELPNSSPHDAIERLTELGVSIEEPKERERKKRRAGARLPYREFHDFGRDARVRGARRRGQRPTDPSGRPSSRPVAPCPRRGPAHTSSFGSTRISRSHPIRSSTRPRCRHTSVTFGERRSSTCCTRRGASYGSRKGARWAR